MTAYRVYHIDGDGRFSAAEWIEAESDQAAIEAARSLDKSIAREIWQGQRFIARVDNYPPEGSQP